MMDMLVFLTMCFIEFGAVDTECSVYELRPQWEMTQEVIDRKIELICENAALIAIEHGSRLTRCEVLENDVTT